MNNVNDLPDFVKQQLSKSPSKSSPFSEMVLAIVNKLDGICSTDDLIINLYTDYQKQVRRTYVANTVHHLIKDEKLYNAGKRGYYTTKKELAVGNAIS